MKINKVKFNLLLAEICLSNKEFCKKADIQRGTLSQIVNGKREARPQTIGKIAKALGVKVTDIIEEQ